VIEGVKISSDIMVSFLEFILDNPQTNSAHAFSAFTKGDLKPNIPVENPEDADFPFEEVETPDVEYEDEDYESSFYANFDENEFLQNNWTTSWEDDSVWEASTEERTTTTTSTTTTTTNTQHPLIMQPEIISNEV
jgi:hypothetical protein